MSVILYPSPDNMPCFVRISELPSEERESFKKWLRRLPLIPGERPGDCALFTDYEQWWDNWEEP